MIFLLDIAACERKGLATRLDQVNFKVGLWKHLRSLKQTIEQLHLCNWFLSPLLCHHLEQRCPLCDSHSRWPSPLQSQIFWSVSPAKAAIEYVLLNIDLDQPQIISVSISISQTSLPSALTSQPESLGRGREFCFSVAISSLRNLARSWSPGEWDRYQCILYSCRSFPSEILMSRHTHKAFKRPEMIDQTLCGHGSASQLISWGCGWKDTWKPEKCRFYRLEQNDGWYILKYRRSVLNP